MNKNIIFKLNKIYKELKNRNLFPLLHYNRGKIVHQKQIDFHRCTKRNKWLFGGNRTGKTECGAVEVIWTALAIHPYKDNLSSAECWVVSLSNRVQKEVSQAKILKYLPKSCIVQVTMNSGSKSSMENGIIECISVKNAFGNISRIWFKSCEEGCDKFQGTSLDLVWFDEEPPEPIYNECKMRVLDRCGTIIGTMTPLKGFTYIYDQIYLNNSNDCEVFCMFMSWQDNPYLNLQEIERLSATMTQDELESRKNGKFMSIDSGFIYSEFDMNVNVIEPFKVPSDWQDILSIDPGLNNPLSCHWYAKDYDGNIYVVAEHYEQNKPVEYHAKKIKEISDKLGWKRHSNGMIYSLIDSAASQRTLASQKSVTELFYDYGILVNPAVNKDVLSGISKVKTYLKDIQGRSRLFIFSNCTNMIREIKTYRWNGFDSPVKKDDHCLDELRYYIMYQQPLKQKEIKSEITLDKERLIKLLKRNNNGK